MTLDQLDLWDRLARLHDCCDVELSSATHRVGKDDWATIWIISVSHRGNGKSPPVSIQADTMLDALLDALLEAENRQWLS